MKLDSIEAAREACSFCPKLCRHACPPAEVERTEQATPTFKQQVALLAASGRRPLDRERAEVLYKCTDCGATTDACRHRVDVGASLREARGRAVREGVAPPEIGWLEARFREHGSPYSRDLAQALEAVLPGARATEGDVGLLASCSALAHHPDELKEAVEVMARVGVSLPIALPTPVCCGYPLDAAGCEAAFAAHAREVAASLSGFSRIVTVGAACAHTFRTRYPEVGAATAFTAAPLVDLLFEHVADWRRLCAPDPQGRRYAYSDPCFLGRRLGRFEEPRAVLRAALGEEPVELGYSRGQALCSGGGGVYPLTHPEEAKGCAGKVVDLFREAGADVLVTGCPSARRKLLQAAPGLEVKSLVGVLAERLRG